MMGGGVLEPFKPGIREREFWWILWIEIGEGTYSELEGIRNLT